MTVPNPLPCGCAAVGIRSLEGFGSDYELHTEYNGVHVKHCPLHQTAKELAEALAGLSDLDDGDEPFAWKHADLFSRAQEALEKAGLR